MGSRSRSRGGAAVITPTVSPDSTPVPVVAGRVGPPGGGGFPAGGRAAATGGTRAVPGTPLPAGAAEEVLRQTAAGSAAAAAARQQALAEWTGPEVSYLDDPGAFENEYREALTRRGRGEEAVPLLMDNATGGLGARGTGRAFGVEIEFDLPPGADRYAALRAIGEDLHAAGLTPVPYQERYHAGHRNPARQHQGGWRFEQDATVSGEIVSPVMWDEPETWRNVARVCEIIRRHGGQATARTGGHVHVGLADYDHTVENHNRLLATVAAYEDVLYRMAQNPAAGAHRGRTWCRPNLTPSAGYSSVDSARGNNAGHHLGVNFEAVRGSRSDHAEFRMWDGSLNPGVIQAQVAMSLGLVAAASRGGYQPPGAERVGTHQGRNPRRRRLAGQEWREDSQRFRQLADTVFRSARSHAQAAALYAVTRWQRP